MRKKIIAIILVFGLVSISFSPQIVPVVKAATKIDLELANLKKMQEIARQKAKEAENQISQIKNQQVATKKEIEFLMDQLDRASKKLTQINEDIYIISAQLVDNGKLLDAASARIEERNKQLKSRIRLMYMNGIVSYMDVLLSATSFNDFVTRMELLTMIASQDKDLLDSEIKDRDEITLKKQQIELQLAEVKSLYEVSNKVRQELVVKEKEKESKLSSLDIQEEELEHITEENEKLLIDLARQESALLRKKSELEKLPYQGGQLGYPLASKGIKTSNYGYRIDPITGRRGAFHSGLDLAAARGTTIVAAETGIVLVSGWFGGYGNCVIIDHGKNTWTLYGHIRDDGLFVRKGDKVVKGQKIAEVGSTGRSTGNHLHFEVRINENAVDPLGYIKIW
jgi:murein DD-endopeptidase MepM/ murein hydrolase activator NlpD